MIEASLLMIYAVIKGNIHSTKEYAANSIFGIVAALSPFLIDAMEGSTEIVKLITALIALFIAGISAWRAWKFKDKK